MVDVIPKHIKDAWDRWNIRGTIFLSLTLQAFLICFSPLRKRTPRRHLIIVIWSSYLLADWSANFAVGLISKNQGKDLKPDDPPQDKKLMALWAPFLLLHLGGPDTITAFALEDNALWLRHVFGLVFQAIAGVYVVLQSLPNSLWVTILLVFISGTIKYLERTTALYSASLDKFRDSMIQGPDPGPNYAKLMEEYKAKKEAKLPTKIILIDEPDKEHRPKKLEHPSLASETKRKELTHLEIAQYAYKFFNTFKGLVVNLIFSFRERDQSIEIFENLEDPEEALRIIEIELGFLYDALFTKNAVLHTVLGTVSRVVASGSLVAAFIIFHKISNKGRDFHGADVVITYILFAVGLVLDFISILLFLFSDWTCAALSSLKDDPDEPLSWKDRFFNWLLEFRKLRWKMQECHNKGEHKCTKEGEKPCIKEGDDKCSMVHVHHMLTTPFFFRRWIRSIVDTLSRNHPWARCTIYPLYILFLFHIPNFIKYLWNVLIEFLGIPDALDLVEKTLFVHGEPMTKELWKFIFEELKNKSKYGDSPENAKRISLARGEWALRDNLPEDAEREKLVRYVTKVDYDQSLLMWHIATEFCYQEHKKETIPEGYDEQCKHYSNREFSKIISDYMMYLLILQPSLMSEVAGIGKIRFRDTLAETDKFFERKRIYNVGVNLATEYILDVNSEIEPVDVKGDRSKSVLFDASRLAKDLTRMEKTHNKDKWEILSKVWVELLCYAACHCDSTAHVEQLSRGGELINFVWLLMAHFGLTNQFQINKGDARAKLIIGK
ncbi:unnamed protein product [Arabidopsis thaliana]|uniref:(thale cress) hypothetical protein n=1 Tax=Arabidopsis thaliana TaxID=3702 RepID=A0A7G2FHQ7_ARATH|nr:unnamed protein product [Arabidopsis thaliana]